MVKAAQIIAKTVIGLLALLLMYNYTRWFFDYPAMLALYEVNAETVTGINMLRTNMSSGVIMIAVFAFLYLFKGKKWLVPALICSASMLFTRTAMMFIVGSSEAVLLSIGLQAFAVIVWIILYRLESLGNSRAPE